MAQPLSTDFPIDPQTTSGTALADILNRFADTVNTTNSGATEPADKFPGMMWLDTSGGGEGVLKMRNAANTGWITLSTPGGAFTLANGTVAAPGLAWSSEPGLGWYRPSASIVRMAAQGLQTAEFGFANAASSYLALTPRAVGASSLYLGSAPIGSANSSSLALSNDPSGHLLFESLAGTATAKPLKLNFPAGVQSVAPVIAPQFGATTGLYLSSSATVLNGDIWRVVKEGNNIRQYFNNDLTHRLDLDIATGNWILGVSLGAFTFLNAGNDASKGVAGAWLANSDERIKTAIEDYTPGLAAVLMLRPRTFAFKTDARKGSARYTSLIAQEAKEAMPDLVTIGPGRTGDIELEDMHTFDPTNITYALVNAVKEIDARLAALEGTTP